MSEPVVAQCPNCHARFPVTTAQSGRAFNCPRCGQPFAAGAGTVPPLPSPQAVGYAGGYPAGGQGPPQGTSGVAIASLVCGILFCIPVTALAALVCGIVGINQTGPGRKRGRGLAIAGTVLGGVGLLMVPVSALMISILLPSLNRARETANRAKCASNMHQIGLGLLLYQQDHNQAYPPDLATLWQSEQLSGSVFVCPSSNDTPAASPAQLTAGGHLSYVYVPPADGTTPGALTPVLYENGADHGGDGTNILFGDGHVSWYAAASAKALLGQPPAAPAAGGTGSP